MKVIPYGEPLKPQMTGLHFNPFPNKPWFVLVCSTSPLKALWNNSGKLSQDTPVLPQVVKLGHAPHKIQV